MPRPRHEVRATVTAADDGRSLEAARVAFSKGRPIDRDALAALAALPFRALWSSEQWDRALATGLGQHTVPLPEEPGSAWFVRPGIEQTCAAIEEAGEGLWRHIVLVGVKRSTRALLGRTGILDFAAPQSAVRFERDLAEAFSAVEAHEQPAPQLICFDGKTGREDRAALQLVDRAYELLDPEGLLVMDGIGPAVIDEAVGIYSLEYQGEQRGPQGTPLCQAILRR
jgi:hypothetical protein